MSRRVWGFWEGEGETRRGREKGQRNGGSPVVRVSGRRHGEKMENHGQRKEKERKGKEGVEGRMAVQLGRGERALAPLSHATPQEDPSLFPGGRPTSFFFSQGSS